MFRDLIFDQFLDKLPDGWPSHVLGWLFSSSNDIVFQNPHFNATDYSTDSSVAIYCIHGTGDRVASFKKIANGILNELPPIVSSIHLLSFEGRAQGNSIPFFAKQVRDKIIANQHRQVILMGHSRGAKVAAVFAEEFASEAGIEVISTHLIAGPFKGSHLALPPLTTLSESVSQMTINSEFSKALAAKMKSSSIRHCFYAAQQDLIVPAENALLDIKSYSRELFAGEGHISIMSSRALMRTLVSDICRACRDYLHIPEDEGMSSVFLANTFQVIERDSLNSPMNETCYELYRWIERLLHTFHLRNAQRKITVLSRLVELLEKGDYDQYPQATTIGELIQAFLQDPDQGDKVGEKRYLPQAILSEQLNYPISLAQSLFAGTSQVKSIDTMEAILTKYGSAPKQTTSYALSELPSARP